MWVKSAGSGPVAVRLGDSSMKIMLTHEPAGGRSPPFVVERIDPSVVSRRGGQREMSTPIYLDYNATTPLAPEVLEAMLPHLRGDFGNPSSIHQFGRRAKAALLEARETMASFLSASGSELVFTGSGTEADNLAILGVVSAEEEEARPRRHLVTSTIAHHAVLNVMRHLEKQRYEVTYLPVDRSGRVLEGALRRALRPDTLLGSILSAHNETGVIQPVKELARISHDAGALFHTDAVQAGGGRKTSPESCASRKRHDGPGPS